MKRYLFTTVIISFLLNSCVKEDFFGLSNYGNIKSIVVSNQASVASIYTDSLVVYVEIPAGVDLSTITIQSLEISSFASSNKGEGDILDLNMPQPITIVAEDGSSYRWIIKPFIASETPQLDNGDLNAWYQTATNYYEPGTDAASTIWGTGNPGTQILNKLATTPIDLGGDNLAAKMETLDNGTLAGAFGAPISAGSIFTGYFDPDNIDLANPQAAIEFGTPFAGRPRILRLKYPYNPGEENQDMDGNALPYSDACDIYALLEIRLSGVTQRLATAWFRSEEIQEGVGVP